VVTGLFFSVKRTSENEKEALERFQITIAKAK
jgi:hypothetical protein